MAAFNPFAAHISASGFPASARALKFTGTMYYVTYFVNSVFLSPKSGR